MKALLSVLYDVALAVACVFLFGLLSVLATLYAALAGVLVPVGTDLLVMAVCTGLTFAVAKRAPGVTLASAWGCLLALVMVVMT